MKALVYKGNNQLEYTDYELTSRKDFEVTVEVKAAGICGSDLHAFLGHDPRRVPPMVLGHEVFGKVVDGEDVYINQYVAINPIVSCDKCSFCLQNRQNLCLNRYMIGMQTQGGFAELVNIDKKNLFVYNKEITTKIAVLAEPTATSIHSINLIKNTSIKPIQEANVLIIGAGSIGLLCSIILKQENCKDITVLEKNPKRHTNIKNIKNVKCTESLDKEQLFDIVIDAVGIEPTRNLSVKHVNIGGVIMHIGLGDSKGTIDFRHITLGEISFLGTYTYNHQEFQTATDLLESGKLNDDLSWIEERPLKDGQEAFEDILNQNAYSAKIVLLPK